MSAKAIATDMRALRGLALSIWHELTPAQRSTLRSSKAASDGTRRLLWNAHARVVAALVGHGLVTVVASTFTASHFYPLTPTCLLVLEVGLADDAAQARRTHRARKGRAS